MWIPPTNGGAFKFKIVGGGGFSDGTAFGGSIYLIGEGNFFNTLGRSIGVTGSSMCLTSSGKQALHVLILAKDNSLSLYLNSQINSGPSYLTAGSPLSHLVNLEHLVFQEQPVVTVRRPFWHVVPANVHVALSVLLPHSENLSNNWSVWIVWILQHDPVTDFISSSFVHQKRNRDFRSHNVSVIAVWLLHFNMVQSGDVRLKKMHVVEHGRVRCVIRLGVGNQLENIGHIRIHCLVMSLFDQSLDVQHGNWLFDNPVVFRVVLLVWQLVKNSDDGLTVNLDLLESSHDTFNTLLVWLVHNRRSSSFDPVFQQLLIRLGNVPGWWIIVV
ncbi:hypothetical protein OGAPHI_002819 [Ogataea philodendri]|uniref:Uncharacterized protein n=1 Tax=Ogataea philodendri TaxID=1378263 RepID=A0A9P8P8J4_9ASCO|nr:uncharacterized protein OGAPHI_002819 [Ogataea philodendri]KAH3667170.1 hypothetical protein OGAPHI_002819 [Ogataea philodendri]